MVVKLKLLKDSPEFNSEVESVAKLVSTRFYVKKEDSFVKVLEYDYYYEGILDIGDCLEKK
jgi:hypothetical protein